MPKPQRIAFPFVLEELAPINPTVKAMFGCHAIYDGRSATKTILFILRNKADHTHDNGIWVATSKEHHSLLKSKISGLRAIKVLGGGPDSNWQNLPLDNPRFEELALDLCQLVLKNDPLIGRIPQSKKSKKAR